METLIRFRSCDIGPPGDPILRSVDWELRPGEAWVVTGPNGGGKSVFAAALAGAVPVRAVPASGTAGATPGEAAECGNPLASGAMLVSFEQAAALVERERANDDSDFVEGGDDPGTSVRRCIVDAPVGGARDRFPGGRGLESHPAVRACGVAPILDRGLKRLSTGEIRRTLLARALVAEPALLVLDEPFEGLDAGARVVLAGILDALAEASVRRGAVREGGIAVPGRAAGSSLSVDAPPVLVLVADRWERIPAAVNRVVEIVDRRISFAGERSAYETLRLARAAAEAGAESLALPGLVRSLAAARDEAGALGAPGAGFSALGGAAAFPEDRSAPARTRPSGHPRREGGGVDEASDPSRRRGESPPDEESGDPRTGEAAPSGPVAESRGSPLVELRSVTVGWSGTVVLDRLSWTVRQGEHWLVRGPNGSGKTTLLELVTGDNPQAYSNDVRIFGRRRGTGETVWELKARMGIVSYRLHLEYRYLDDSSLEEVLVSGLHDSIGLYVEAGDAEYALARRWLGLCGFAGRGSERFGRLSFGEQRTILVARAAIKSPPLLVLDEPCHGLDPAHRGRVLELLAAIAGRGYSTLIHVTHDPGEVLDCERHVLELRPGSSPPWVVLDRDRREDDP